MSMTMFSWSCSCYHSRWIKFYTTALHYRITFHATLYNRSPYFLDDKLRKKILDNKHKQYIMNRGVLDYLVLEVLEPISAFVKEAYNVEKKG
jgi:hypothetical protein